jgi:Na+/proline symporter
MVVRLLPEGIGLSEALHLAGKMGKVNVIDTKFDLDNRYNIWSGIIGGFFLQLSYFGTDQSQVGRYLTGKSITQSRAGLIMNGLVKIPMQFFILLIGVLVFSFYQFHPAPLFFNKVESAKIEHSIYRDEYQKLENEYSKIHSEKLMPINLLHEGIKEHDSQKIDDARVRLQSIDEREQSVKKSLGELMLKNDPGSDTNDTNYIFLSFVTTHLPTGIIGLLIAIIFLASMGSTASGLNSLASTTTVDIYKRMVNQHASESRYLAVSRAGTVGWGIFCVITGIYAGKMGNLIEAVNILGSLFYGTILGIFVVAFYMKRTGGQAVFFGALLAELFIVIAWKMELTAFLWLNVIGCLLVMIFAFLFQAMFNWKRVK